MRPLYIYISLFFFAAGMLAPSTLIVVDMKSKSTKVAKLFDREEEDDSRDNDPEKEKERDASEKIFDSFFAAVVIPEDIQITLVHYHRYHYYLSEPAQELITPPPRG